MLFYDIMILYFKATGKDELRESGFSKDRKIATPRLYLISWSVEMDICFVTLKQGAGTSVESNNCPYSIDEVLKISEPLSLLRLPDRKATI